MMSLVAQIVTPLIAEIELREIAVSICHDLLSRQRQKGTPPSEWTWINEALSVLHVDLLDKRLRFEIMMITHRRSTKAIAKAERRQRRRLKGTRR